MTASVSLNDERIPDQLAGMAATLHDRALEFGAYTLPWDSPVKRAALTDLEQKREKLRQRFSDKVFIGRFAIDIRFQTSCTIRFLIIFRKRLGISHQLYLGSDKVHSKGLKIMTDFHSIKLVEVGVNLIVAKLITSHIS